MNVAKRLDLAMVGCDIAARAGVVVLLAVVMSRLSDQSDGSAVVRALWLLPVAMDPFWRSTALLALLAATLLTIAAATIVVSSADSPVVSDTA